MRHLEIEPDHAGTRLLQRIGGLTCCGSISAKRCRVRRCTTIGLCFCLFSLLLVLQSCISPKSSSPKISLSNWSAQNNQWMLAQITPNTVVPDPVPTRRRLIVSYDIAPEVFPQGFHRSATYDNALAAIAFTVKGNTHSAAYTLHAITRLIRADGSLWFSYNTANNWPDENYHESAMVRAGAIGWVGYALAFYLRHVSDCEPGDRGCLQEQAHFLKAANRLAEYALSLQVDDPPDPRHGLLRLGYATVQLAYRAETNEVIEIYLDEPALGISSENNLSAWFFFRELYRLTGEQRWKEAAARIRDGLLAGAWNDGIGQLNRGFHFSGTPDPVKALDCASWGVLFFLEIGETKKAATALAVMDEYYLAKDGELTGYRPYFDHPIYRSAKVGRFFYGNDPRKEWRDLPLVWTEGTLGVALAYLRSGMPAKARTIIERLRVLQVESSGLRYASQDVPYEMASAPGVAASAWLVLVAEAMLGNPLAEAFWQ